MTRIVLIIKRTSAPAQGPIPTRRRTTTATTTTATTATTATRTTTTPRSTRRTHSTEEILATSTSTGSRISVTGSKTSNTGSRLGRSSTTTGILSNTNGARNAVTSDTTMRVPGITSSSTTSSSSNRSSSNRKGTAVTTTTNTPAAAAITPNLLLALPVKRRHRQGVGLLSGHHLRAHRRRCHHQYRQWSPTLLGGWTPRRQTAHLPPPVKTGAAAAALERGEGLAMAA
mmetsp:Transcript_66350/g.133669  ORF Transcript_66350/g.133669 Transcript_66350/m.133669 type:complete len:229 (+) Transcript_66350:409-1095(+)